MTQKTKIEWTQVTWNPLAGCTAKSPGCLNCYAAAMSGRLEAMGQAKYAGTTVKKGDRRVFTGQINYDESALVEPLKRRKPTTYFVNSMSDLFWGDDEDLATARRLGVKNPQPVPDEFITKVFDVMARTPWHTYQILTKRAARAKDYMNNGSLARRVGGNEGFFPSEGNVRPWPLPNVHLGVSVEDQKTADERIPLLLQTPNALPWISYEPALGPVDFTNLSTFRFRGAEKVNALTGELKDIFGVRVGSCLSLKWLVSGGESGTGARPCDIAWIRSIIAQCKAADVPVFYKQGGASNKCPHSNKGGCFDCFPDDLKIREFPK